MKKIMFNDRFGLTKAVINGTKTQTRRDATRLSLDYEACKKLGWYQHLSVEEYILRNASYKVGEVIAVAQSYQDLGLFVCRDLAGYRNKMFVKAELMPNRIKITRVRLQLLQDISDDDCLREGIYYDKENGKSVGYPFAVPFYYTYRGAFNTKTGRMLHWTTPREAYAVLIDKISGKDTWERNPYVLAYDFELVTDCHRLS